MNPSVSLTASSVVFNSGSENFGVITAASVTFQDGSANSGSVLGNAVFNGSAINRLAGLVSGNATFAATAINSGTVQGNVTIDDSAYAAWLAANAGVSQYTGAGPHNGQWAYNATEYGSQADAQAAYDAANNSGGGGDNGGGGTTTIPYAPTITTANFGGGVASFEWTPNGDGGSSITNYHWELFDNQAGVNAYTGDTTELSKNFDLSWILTTDGRTYTFSVSAENAVGRSYAASSTGVAGNNSGGGGGSSDPFTRSLNGDGYADWSGSDQGCFGQYGQHGNLFSSSPTLAVGVGLFAFDGSSYVSAGGPWQIVVNGTRFGYDNGVITDVGSC
jgi:hypothetical protein